MIRNKVKLTGSFPYTDSISISSSSTSNVKKKKKKKKPIGKSGSGRGRNSNWPKEDCFALVKKFIDNCEIDPKLVKTDFLKKESQL